MRIPQVEPRCFSVPLRTQIARDRSRRIHRGEVDRLRSRLRKGNCRKHAVQLLEREEWFRVTMTSLGAAVIATDDHGVVNYLNPLTEQLIRSLRRKAARVNTECTWVLAKRVFKGERHLPNSRHFLANMSRDVDSCGVHGSSRSGWHSQGSYRLPLKTR